MQPYTLLAVSFIGLLSVGFVGSDDALLAWPGCGDLGNADFAHRYAWTRPYAAEETPATVQALH